MNMKAKRSIKPMRGFMCHPQAATAVCMAGDDGGSIIVPRRCRLEHATLVKPAKYSRLTGPANKMSTTSKPLPTIMERDHKSPPVMTKSSSPVFQVVVMRVSLHCQGCAGKIKKHLSKMEGVTSFSIDLEEKRVTVIGHVSPSGVLESISKVKKAELWSS